jgi:hypothetical protein
LPFSGQISKSPFGIGICLRQIIAIRGREEKRINRGALKCMGGLSMPLTGSTHLTGKYKMTEPAAEERFKRLSPETRITVL